MNLSSLLPSLSKDQISKLELLADLFLEWNQKINLSAIRTREGVLLKHIVDSLLILPFHLIPENAKVLDLGTGGGFPGLALAIAYPNTSFVLLDSTQKKIKAVSDMVSRLRFSNVETLCARAEELSKERAYREQFDLVVTRAFGKFPVVLEYSLSFLKIGGKLIAYQGPEILDQISQYDSLIGELRSKFVTIKESILPEENAQRTFVILEKTGLLPPRFPRRVH